MLGDRWIALLGAAQGVEGETLLEHMIRPLAMAFVFGIVGMALFCVFIAILIRIAPFSLRKEIEEDQNVAVGVIVASMILGIALIIAAALLG